jgi:D-alanyl-D-alanine carboxypeptidase
MFMCIVTLAVLASLGGIVYGWVCAQQAIARDAAAMDTLRQETEKTLTTIKERKIAEEKARVEAEKKAIAAKEFAEQAKAGMPVTDSTACNVSGKHNNPASIDVLVNKKHCIQPVTYAPSDLVTSNGATLSAKAIDHYNQLFMAAAAAGQGFSVTSSYRSYGSQVSTFGYWVSISGEEGADTYSARPGYSEHQTGYVIDVAANGCALDCFGSTSQYAWLQQNAANYGFIQRYYAGFEAVTGYKAEEWHYRYVGVATAKDMKAKGVKTLEQYWSLPGGGY